MSKKFMGRRWISLFLILVMLLPFVLNSCVFGNDDDKGDGNNDDHPEGTVLYTIKAKTQGGMLIADATVTVYNPDGTEAATGVTGEDGILKTWLYPGKYTVALSNLKVGYTANDPIEMPTDGGEVSVIANTAVIEEDIPKTKTSYYPGDVIYDFSFLNNYGETVKLSELLEEKKLIVINFWASWCSNCRYEFPAIQQAYAEYCDVVEFIALNNYDNSSYCDSYRDENDYSFPMIPDANGLYSYYTTYVGGAYLPISVFVDRYGVIIEIISGGDTSASSWKNTFAYYTSDDYVQDDITQIGGEDDEVDVEKPDVEMPASSEIEAAINGKDFNATYTAPTSDTIWPWVLSDDKTAIQPSNYGKASSSAMITTELTFKAGDIFTFDYKYSIEYDSWETQVYDMFAVYVDGQIIQKMYTYQEGWVTCYAYTPLEAGTHTITLLYSKDSGDSMDFMDEGNEYLYVTNLRMITLDELESSGGSMNVWRPAAYGTSSNSTKKTYENYVSVVMASDGFYHVENENGPILLAKLTGSTQWSSTSLMDLAYAGYLKIDGVDYSALAPNDESKSYWWLENNSDLGYTPVDSYLADMLDLFASEVGDGANHEFEWLEFCSYFDHYGKGEGITKVTDVRRGIDPLSAFTATEGTNYAYVNRIVVPRGLYFEFTPEKTGVYTVYSLNEGFTTSYGGNEIDTIAWLRDDSGNWIDEGDDEAGQGHFQIWHTLEAGRTYYIAVGLDPVDYLGSFNFNIEYVCDKMDIITVCTNGWTFGLDDDSNYYIWRNYDIEVALGDDGYYHQITGYNKDGTPILDYSETGYIYADFLGVSNAEAMDYIQLGSTLKDIIENYYQIDENTGYYVKDENGNKVKKDFFDFTWRVDGSGNSLEDLGNLQAIMEEYLAKINTDEDSQEYGFVKVDKQLAEILDIVMELYGFNNVKDQWLMFCCFLRHV